MKQWSRIRGTGLSKRQVEILDFIQTFQEKKGYSPSLGEIADHFKVSIPTIHQHKKALEMKGMISFQKGGRRSIALINRQSGSLVEIPLMGIIAAGGPIEAIRNPEPIEVPRNMMLSGGKNYFALRVTGTSMIEEGISDGDIVIIRQQPTVENGEKAVAYLPEKNTVTLKRIFKEKNRIKLVPANKVMKPFYEKNIEIQGRVMGVLRQYP